MAGRDALCGTAGMFSVAALALLCEACSPAFSYRQTGVPNEVRASKRIELLFAKTKLVCFGRYALEVPSEAEVIFGESDIEVVDGGAEVLASRPVEDVAKIFKADATAEITYNGKGPVPDSWTVQYSEGEIAKSVGLHFFTTYVSKGELTYILRDALDGSIPHAKVVDRQARGARNVRNRTSDEVPNDPGYCFEDGFMADELYAEQETANAGVHFPSFPDVTFSISSNKDAYADYDKAEFETRWRSELSLLNRIQKAKDDQPGTYPNRTVLREGKRYVNHWKGEESLIKRENGVHDFQWAFVGTPKDVANPSEFSVTMYTKVEHNTVGAASAASLSDEEAVALYDRLLSGLKFRVNVPGAPPGSYHVETVTSPPKT